MRCCANGAAALGKVRRLALSGVIPPVLVLAIAYLALPWIDAIGIGQGHPTAIRRYLPKRGNLGRWRFWSRPAQRTWRRSCVAAFDRTRRGRGKVHSS